MEKIEIEKIYATINKTIQKMIGDIPEYGMKGERPCITDYSNIIMLCKTIHNKAIETFAEEVCENAKTFINREEIHKIAQSLKI